MAGVFHSYDIRGIFGNEIDISFAYHLGVTFAKQYRPTCIVVGHDERIGGEVLSRALIDALTDVNVKVIDIGQCTTPMVWHAVNHHKTDGGIMVTASHNPKEYNGFKLCTKFATPIGYDTGLSTIEKEMSRVEIHVPRAGKNVTPSENAHYKLFEESLVRFVPDEVPLRVVADCSNSAVAPILVSLFAGSRHELILLNENPDGNFPGHEPNPMIESTTTQLSKRVISESADVGVIFDGDADRVVFVDEKGVRVRQDSITALIACELIKRSTASRKRLETPIILADLRSSKNVEELVVENGGQLYLTKVGRPHIISQMRATKGLFAGELSGHYYYHDFFCCDDGVRTLLEVMQLLSTSQQKMSELTAVCDTYSRSGETNLVIKDTQLVIDAIRQTYTDKKPLKVLTLDGISVYFDTFWFNVRSSNTESVLRVNMEANSKDILEAEFDALITIIKRFMR